MRSSPIRMRARGGFTILEMLVSMTMLLAVLTVAANLFANQSRAVASESGRLDAMQNARFGVQSLERELRMAGAGTDDGQPMLVAGSRTMIAFNANLVSSDTTDPFAVYVNSDMPLEASSVFDATKAITLPGTADIYPDSTYRSGGIASNAETVIYWLADDAEASDPLIHTLYRRVNSLPPEIVARNILVGSGDQPFQYLRLDQYGTLQPISLARLPLLHLEKEHLSPRDTGSKGGLLDSVRVVRIQLRAAFDDGRGNRTIRSVESRVRIANAGLANRTTCGQAPLGVTVGVTTPLINGQRAARITWARSVDEAAGERDVERYAVYRRLPTTPGFGEPLVILPAGSTSYAYTDQVVSGQKWVYGVAAVDCTPEFSPVAQSATITIP